MSGYYSFTSLIVTCLGALIGSFGLLWLRGFYDPWRTAPPMLVLLVMISYPIAALSYELIGYSAQSVLTPTLIATPAALAGRAIARWWTLRHL